MALDFQDLLRSRTFECHSTIRGIKIIEQSKNLFSQLLQEALDQLYMERLLEDGKCFACNVKTSKCCFHCGTNSCIGCQKFHFPCPKLTTSGYPSKDSPDLLYIKPEPAENKNVYNGYMYNGGTNLNIGNYKKIDSELQETFRYASLQNVSRVELINTAGLENQWDSDKENPVKAPSKSTTKKYTKTKKKTISTAKKEETSDSGSVAGTGSIKKFETKKPSRKFVPLQKLKVKLSSKHRNFYWAVEEKDQEKFQIIQERLAREFQSYPVASDVKDDFIAMKFNQTWHRCQVFSQGAKNVVLCIDTGQIFCPKHLSCLELPDDLKAEDALSFEVMLEDLIPPEKETDWLDVQVVKLLPIGAYEVRLCEEKKKRKKGIKKEVVSEEIVSETKTSGKETDAEEKKKIKSKKMNKMNGKRSVVDELKLKTRGIFLPGKVGKKELFGCLAPDDVTEAMCCYNRITGLYMADGKKIDANVGDDVIVAGDDTIGRRGIVKSKEGDTYEVQLVDYGYTVKVDDVYQLPENTTDMIQLACRVTLLEKLPRRYDEFEVKRAYVFEVVEKKSQGEWLCKFATYPDLHEDFAFGIVDKPWKRRLRVYDFVPFEDGCKVIVTGISSQTEIHIKHFGGEWEGMLEELNLRLNRDTQVSELKVDNVEVGDILLCRYREDELWYRARVLQKKGDFVRVVFVDYGNFQVSTASELNIMPEWVMEPFFSRKVKLVGGNSFSSKGRDYLNDMKEQCVPMILKYNGSDLSSGVKLFDEDGRELNKILFETQEAPEDNPPDAGFDKEKFLKPDNFKVGLVENFVCLHVDRENFMDSGVFWAVDPENSHFKYVIDLGSKLSKHCESNREEFKVEIGMLCIAKYQDAWYRGVIRDRIGDLIDVFFVDFGNFQVLDISDIRRMVPEFFEVPATAVKCYLNGWDKMSKDEILKYRSFLFDNLNNNIRNKVVVEKVTENLNCVTILV